MQLDGPEGIGRGRTVGFSLAEYADLDHGYAATVHKAQSVTVDRAHVLATEGMDRHLAYVALSRHRDAVSLHWGADSFADAAALAWQLGRERAKDTTLDYAAGDGKMVRAYAERRGLDPLRPDSAIVVRRDAVWQGEPIVPALDTPAPSQFDPVPEPKPHQRYERRPEPLAPLLPAEPLQPVSEADVAALLADRLGAIDRLPALFGQAYRDPDGARARLDALLQTHGSEEAVAEVLRKAGPQLLGKLRGSKGLFASGDAISQRGWAESAARDIPDRIVQQHRGRELAEAGVRAALAIERGQATVEVPGLSAAALVVLQALQAAGAAWTLPTEPTVGAMSGIDQDRAAAVARIWGEVLTRPALAAEFERFRAAVLERLPDQWRELVKQWEDHQAAQFSAAVLHLPQRGVAIQAGQARPEPPALSPQVFAAVFVQVIDHARVLTALHQVHAARMAQDADLPMRAIRDRLAEEHMAPWWRAESQHWSAWEDGQRSGPAKDRMPQAQANAWREQRIEAERARIDVEVRALPPAELVQIKAGWDEQERQAEAIARTRRSAAPSRGHSPRPE